MTQKHLTFLTLQKEKLDSGPSARTSGASDRIKEAKEEKREWEDVTILRNKEEITEANKEWIKLHFKTSESKNQEKEDKINITSKEVREAMKIMGKGKAGATDNISDMIYMKKE